MSVGGHIIEIAPERFEGRDLTRIRVVDSCGDETHVWTEPFTDGPKLGDEIWWQSGKVYFDNDKRWLTKVGPSGAA